MSRHYHVAYNLVTTAGNTGSGDIDITYSAPIRSAADITVIKEEIQRRYPEFTVVVILSWQRYEEDDS